MRDVSTLFYPEKVEDLHGDLAGGFGSGPSVPLTIDGDRERGR